MTNFMSRLASRPYPLMCLADLIEFAETKRTLSNQYNPGRGNSASTTRFVAGLVYPWHACEVFEKPLITLGSRTLVGNTSAVSRTLM